MPVGEREVVREHREDDRQGEVVVVHGPLLALGVPGRVRLLARLLRPDELPVVRDDHEEDVRRHDRAEHRADLDVGGPWGEQRSGAPGGEDDESPDAYGEEPLVEAEQPAEPVVDDPGEREPADRERDRLAGAEVGDRRVDEERRGVRVVDDRDQGEPGEPGRVGLPLEPVELLREPLGRDLELLDPVEAAAVDLPHLAADAPRRVRLELRRLEVVVERDEVERRPDPGDPGDHVQPAEDEIAPAPPVVGRA